MVLVVAVAKVAVQVLAQADVLESARTDVMERIILWDLFFHDIENQKKLNGY